MPGLSRRYSQTKEQRAMRSVPQRQRLGSFGAQHQRASGPVSPDRSARSGGLLRVPQSGLGWTVQSASAVDRMRKLPPQGIQFSEIPESSGTGFFDGLPGMPSQYG